MTTPTPTVPAPTVPTTPEQEVEHPVPEPGDDRGVDPVDDGNSGPGNGPAPTPAPAFDQAFSSAGGSITVTVANGAVSLASSSPAAGFGAEVHDNGPEPGRGALLLLRRPGVADPGRARQRRPDLGDHPAR